VYAGIFAGWIYVQGDLDVNGSKNFRIDHPLWPTQQVLLHSGVESSEPKNMYRGSVMLDLNGQARVTLPAYFQALNRDFRYQLTSIGAAANPFVLKEIENNVFWIGGSRPGVRVSWQVTGVRNDARFRERPFVTVRRKAHSVFSATSEVKR